MILAGTVLAFGWSALWIALAVPRAAEGGPQTLGAWLAAFVGCTGVLLFIALPAAGGDIGAAARWIHHAAIIGLGGFLLAAEFLRATARRQARRGNQEATSATLRQLWWLTELAPGPCAVAILLSGLRLVYEVPGVSIREPWLFWLLVMFAFFFADGLCFYLPTVRRLATSRLGDEGIVRFQLTLHAVSFPLVFALACGRWALPHPLRPACDLLTKSLGFIGGRWPQVVSAAVVVGLVSLGVWLFRVRTKIAPLSS